MDIHDVLARLDNVRSLPSGFSARCPAHDDKVSSLMVNSGKDQPIVVHCHAGCEPAAVTTALGLAVSDLMGNPKCVAVYEYQHHDGTRAYTVERWVNPKTFRIPGGLPPAAERVLYQLPAIDYARSVGATVYLVEGEKDVHAVNAAGHVATTNVGGANAWLGHYAEQLKGCHVVVVADNDQPGRTHARFAASTLKPYAETVTLTVPRHGKDVSDLLKAGYTLDELEPLSETDDLAAYLASNVKTRKIDWAWRRYFAFGKLAIIEGDPGDGKSILTVDLAARWSSGALMPDGVEHDGPYRIFMVSAEDDLEDTIVPRLIAAGARLDHVTLFPHGATPERPFEFATDLPALERRAAETGVRIIIFDPLTAFLASSVDTHNDMQVRHALYPLAALAARTRAAVIAVRHLNKGSSGTKAVYRGNGSIAFTGAARTGFLVATDPGDPVTRLLASVKTNISGKAPTLRYRIEATDAEIPYLAWKGVAPISAQDALDGPRRFADDDEEKDSKKRMRQYEIQFLTDVLKDGPMSWADIVEIGKRDGFADRTLRRARADAGLIKETGSDGNRGAVWRLREESSVPDDGHLATWPRDNGALVGDDKTVAKWPSDTGKIDSEREPRGQMQNGQNSGPDARSAWLAAPRVCGICRTDVDVVGFDEPLFIYRCVNHHPDFYAG